MKVALITGASRGIGRAIANRLATDGHHVLINYLSNESAALDCLNEIKEAGGSGEIIQFNVRNMPEVEAKLDEWKANNPEKVIQVLINNAGIRKDNLMVWLNEEDWRTVIEIHLFGFFNVTQNVMKEMIRSKWGRIINIVSLSGLKGVPGQTNYSAAKAGVIGATKALAQEIARKKITVNAIAPGFIKTEMLEGLDEKELSRAIPMKRFGEAKEVADLVGFMASEQSSYITGEVININGGIYS